MMACRSYTGVVSVVVIAVAGNTPPAPPEPTQETSQSTEITAASEVCECRYVKVHAPTASASRPGAHATPSPAHTRATPLLGAHVVETGLAVTSAHTAPTAVRCLTVPGLFVIHHHVGKFTNGGTFETSGFGLYDNVGVGNTNRFRASAATIAGVTTGTPAGAAPPAASGTHTVEPVPSAHACRYAWPRISWCSTSAEEETEPAPDDDPNTAPPAATVASGETVNEHVTPDAATADGAPTGSASLGCPPVVTVVSKMPLKFRLTVGPGVGPGGSSLGMTTRAATSSAVAFMGSTRQVGPRGTSWQRLSMILRRAASWS